MRILVGNLDDQTTERHLEELFVPFGAIRSIKIVSDINTGKSKGFGFVEMHKLVDAENAIKKLNDTVFQERPLKVSEAYPRKQ